MNYNEQWEESADIEDNTYTVKKDRLWQSQDELSVVTRYDVGLMMGVV